MADFKPLHGYTKNQILERLREIKEQAKVSRLGPCSYLTNDGRRCAVGMFIDKDFWKAEGQVLDGDVHDLLDEYPDLIYKMPFERYALEMIQRKHDEYPDPECSNIGNFLAEYTEQRMSEQGYN